MDVIYHLSIKLNKLIKKMNGSADINQTIVHSLQSGFQLSSGWGLHGNTLLFEDSSFPTTLYVSEYAAFIIIHIQFNNLFAVVKNPVYHLMDQNHPGINIYENVLVFWVWENQNP